MMINKKLWIIVLVLFCYLCLTKTEQVNASNYNGFSEVMLEEGKLLKNFTKDDYEQNYKSVSNRKFWGWNINIINKNVKANYIRSTAFEATNDGKDPHVYEVNVTTEQKIKTVLSASGEIKFDVKGKVKDFANNLSQKIGYEAKVESLIDTKKTEKLSIKVEENTKLLVTVVGSGFITNGVGAYYSLWLRQMRGGFEYFTIIQEFNRIEKVKNES